jgi:4'-phosphopantetheinyl transferase EntD
LSGLFDQVLLASVLVPGLVGAELHDHGQALALDPQEARLVAGAAEKRRRDFALGRACAHAALAKMGRDEGPIAKADNGAPLWPAGLVGSITHTHGYAAALAARAGDFAGLGVDAERIGGVTEDLWLRLFDAGERAHLARIPDPAALATLFFSAKEACHKAGRQSVLRFHDFHVVLADKRFTARCGEQEFEGRHVLAGGLVLTAAWLA